MRVSIWHGALVGIIISAIVLILFSLFAGPFLSGTIVEIAGAFLGVFAAVVLGEILKLRQDSQVAMRVRQDLTKELALLVAQGKEKPDNPAGYTMPYWDASVTAGELGVLDSNVRRMLVIAYNSIRIHNHCADQCQDRADQPGSTPERAKHYKQVAMRSNTKTLQKVSNILTELGEYEGT